MSYKIPVYEPSLSGNEKKYVLDCLDSTWISSKGKYINQFEEAFAGRTGIAHAASVSNGTVALHVALVALGIGQGDEVIVPTLTYVASVNAIAYTGAKPVFVDSLPGCWQMDPEEVKRKITLNTKAIMAVHLYGSACDLETLSAIAKQNKLYLIEDCAESFGTTYQGKHTGSIGDIASFSFFGNKTITTGEGGMVATNDAGLHDKVMHYKGQGLAKNREYWHDVIGYNYRMTNICAAIGLAQIEQADQFIKQKRQVASWYKKYIQTDQVVYQEEFSHVEHSYWMFSILTKQAADRDLLRAKLKEAEVETRPLFHPAHTMPIYFEGLGKYPVAEDLSQRGMNLPSYPGLKEEDIKYIANIINQYFQ